MLKVTTVPDPHLAIEEAGTEWAPKLGRAEICWERLAKQLRNTVHYHCSASDGAQGRN
jgi:hypothetical protein